MGQAEERNWMDLVGLCEESIIWFEGMPVVVCNMRFILKAEKKHRMRRLRSQTMRYFMTENILRMSR